MSSTLDLFLFKALTLLNSCSSYNCGSRLYNNQLGRFEH